MPVPMNMEFFIDQSRCIGCESCVQACTECDSHKGHSMIHLEYVDRSHSVQTVPVVCMHCHSPTCAEVCPADAIKRTEDGVVQTARKPRCIACNNCVLACPFGVPKMKVELELMMKCDMCYDRTSTDRRPMCATVCPSGALFYGTREEIEKLRPQSAPFNRFKFGQQTITTKVNMMAPRHSPPEYLDVLSAMQEAPRGRQGAVGYAEFIAFRGGYVMSQSKTRKISLTPDGEPLSEQPVWRQDFPIDWPQDQFVARRDFHKVPGPH